MHLNYNNFQVPEDQRTVDSSKIFELTVTGFHKVIRVKLCMEPVVIMLMLLNTILPGGTFTSFPFISMTTRILVILNC